MAAGHWLPTTSLTYQLPFLSFIIEIATQDFITTKMAVDGGADRIELCAALSEGGLTPSYGTIKKCRESFAVPLFPIIRPRSGDFLYSGEEFDVMMNDVKLCKDLGCDGVVLGLLNKDGSLDVKRTAKLSHLAYPLDLTFHRAFDRCGDPFKTMEELIELGCSRILTSGQQPTAPQGVDLLAQLVKAADNRIIIMPGSGVRKENIKALADKTGAVEFHASLRRTRKTGMAFIHPAFAGSEESYANPLVEAEEVKALRKALTV